MSDQDPARTGTTRRSAAPTSAAPSARRTRLGRRAVAWLVLAPALAGGLLAGLGPSGAIGTAAALAVAALGAATLARYVPTVGTRLELGCTPCAVASGLSVPVAIAVLAAGMAPLAVGIAAFGLVQRLRQPDTCPT